MGERRRLTITRSLLLLLTLLATLPLIPSTRIALLQLLYSTNSQTTNHFAYDHLLDEGQPGLEALLATPSSISQPRLPQDHTLTPQHPHDLQAALAWTLHLPHGPPALLAVAPQLDTTRRRELILLGAIRDDDAFRDSNLALLRAELLDSQPDDDTIATALKTIISAQHDLTHLDHELSLWLTHKPTPTSITNLASAPLLGPQTSQALLQLILNSDLQFPIANLRVGAGDPSFLPALTRATITRLPTPNTPSHITSRRLLPNLQPLPSLHLRFNLPAPFNHEPSPAEAAWRDVLLAWHNELHAQHLWLPWSEHLNNPNPELREASAAGLSLLTRPIEIGAPLAQILLDDPNPQLRAHAARLLGRLVGPPDELLPLWTQALQDPHPLVISQTLLGLAQRQGLPDTLRPLLLSLLEHPDPDITMAAADALTPALQHPGWDKLNPLEREAWLSLWDQALADNNRTLAQTLATPLSHAISSPTILQRLTSHLDTFPPLPDDNPQLILALSHSPNPTLSQQTLNTLLLHDNPHIQLLAAEASLLSHNTPSSRVAIFDFLATRNDLNTQHLRQLIHAAARSGEPTLQRRALSLLQHLPSPNQHLDALLDWRGPPLPELQHTLLDALSTPQPPHSATLLLAQLWTQLPNGEDQLLDINAPTTPLLQQLQHTGLSLKLACTLAARIPHTIPQHDDPDHPSLLAKTTITYLVGESHLSDIPFAVALRDAPLVGTAQPALLTQALSQPTTTPWAGELLRFALRWTLPDDESWLDHGPALLEAAPSPEAQRQLAIVLAETQALDPQERPALLDALVAIHDKLPEDQRADILRGLATIPMRTPERLLDDARKSPLPELQIEGWAAVILGPFPDPGIYALATFVEDPNPNLRARALHALGRSQGRLPLAELLARRSLWDEDPNVRAAAIDALPPSPIPAALAEDLLCLIRASQHRCDRRAAWRRLQQRRDLPWVQDALDRLRDRPVP